MTYKLLEPNIWKPENEGDEVEGNLVKIADSYTYDNKAYTLENEEGLILVFGTIVLDDKMTLVDIGDKIKIVFKGTKESEKGKNPTKMFDVYKDEQEEEQEEQEVNIHS